MRVVETEASFFLSRLEAARLLACSDRHVDALIAKGFLRAVRAGRRVLVFRESLEEFVRTGTGPLMAAGVSIRAATATDPSAPAEITEGTDKTR